MPSPHSSIGLLICSTASPKRPGFHPGRLAKEATVVVFLNDVQEFLHRANFRVRWIAMPFQIGALPKDLPGELALVVGRLCNCAFENRVPVHYEGRSSQISMLCPLMRNARSTLARRCGG